MMHCIASVIHFCTNDVRYLKKCLEACHRFSMQVIVAVCDHFFDGTLENYSLLERIYEENPHVAFIEFAYDPLVPYGKFVTISPEHPDWVHFWHNAARLIPYYFLKEEIEYVFLIDVDEIIEERKFTKWLEGNDYRRFAALRFSSYWYFKTARYRAKTWPDASLLLEKKRLSPSLFLNPDERMGLFYSIPGEKQRLVHGLDGLPMIHHYSWVKTKREMLHKAKSWGHHWERNWEGLIEEEFSRDFNGRDFVRHYEYEEVEPYFDPLSEDISASFPHKTLEEHRKQLKNYSHVQRVDARDIFKKDLSLQFNISID